MTAVARVRAGGLSFAGNPYLAQLDLSTIFSSPLVGGDDVVQLCIGHLVDADDNPLTEDSAVSEEIIAGDALLLPVLEAAAVDSDGDGLPDDLDTDDVNEDGERITNVLESDPLHLFDEAPAPIHCRRRREVPDSGDGVQAREDVTVSLSLGNFARSLGCGQARLGLILTLPPAGGRRWRRRPLPPRRP